MIPSLLTPRLSSSGIEDKAEKNRKITKTHRTLRAQTCRCLLKPFVRLLYHSSSIRSHDLQRQRNASSLKAANIKSVLSPAHGKIRAVPLLLASNQKDLVTVPRDS